MNFLMQLRKNKSFDLIIKDVKTKCETVTLIYVATLVDGESLNIIGSGISKLGFNEFINTCSQDFVKSNNEKEIESSLYSGTLIIVFNEEYFMFDIKKIASRGIEEANEEKALRSSKEAFNENINDNLNLIRNKIHSSSLIIESFILTNLTLEKGYIIYIENVCDNKLVLDVKNKLKNIDVNSLIMKEKALEKFLTSHSLNLFPYLRFTQRVDVTSISLINGKCIILLENSNTAIIVPASLFDHLTSVEEYKENYLVGNFTRLIRTLGGFLSMLLTPLFICIALDPDNKNGVINIPPDLLDSSSVLKEVVLGFIFIELIRLSLIHSPSSLSSSISLIGALVLSNLILELNLISPYILLFISFQSILVLITPSYELSLTNRLLGIVLSVIACLFFYEGLLICFIILFAILSSMNLFSRHYLYPLIPFDRKDFLNLFILKKSSEKKNN